MLQLCSVFTFGFSLFVSSHVTVGPIEFDLPNQTIEDIDEAASFPVTQGDVTAIFSTTAGVLNRTASGFGVNATGSGDDTDALDDGAGIAESIAISFTSPIQLLGITVSGFGSSDLGQLTTGTDLLSIIGSGFLDAGAPRISSGNEIMIRFLRGNGFSLDSISVSAAAIPSAGVPEPGTLILLVIGGLGFLGAGARVPSRNRDHQPRLHYGTS